MTGKIPHIERIEDIRLSLVNVARQRQTITYATLAGKLGMKSPQGPWKAVLDELSKRETADGRPDITYILVRKGTGYPGQIEFKSANPPSEHQKVVADKIKHDVWEYYSDHDS
jgi:hypothetical protein